MTAKAEERRNVTSASPKFEIRHKTGVSATAQEVDGEFVVLEGSQALKDAGYVSNSYADLRRRLIENDVLREDADRGVYVFVANYAFKSVSAAAAVILDRNANGRTEWKVAGSTEPYDEWQRRQAGVGAEP